MRYISRIAIGAMVVTLTTIFGCSGGVSGPRRLVAVQVTPSAPALAKGTSQQFKATGIYSDHTNDDMSSQVTWRTSDPSVAQVSPSGLATGTGVGNAVISAYVSSLEGKQAIQVTPAELESIEISPPSNTAVGDRKQFTATGIFSDDTTQDLTKAVTWSSSSEAVVTISNSAGSEGLATFLRSGTASIAASFASVSSSVISGSTKVNVSEASLVAIHVSPVRPKMAVGTRIQLTAMGIYSDHTTQNLTGACTWESSDWDKGEVSNAPGLKGQVIAFSEGAITAKAIFVAPTGEKLEGSTEVEINDVTLETIQVKPTLPVIGIASTIQFTATGVFSNKTSQDLTNLVTWYSSNEDVAEVSNAAGSKGVAKGLTAGGTVISAAFKEVSGSTELTVTAVNISRIEITVVNPYAPFTPPPPITLEGAKVQLRATAIYEDNSIQDVTGAATWESDDNSIAVAANNPKGELTGLSVGSTAVKATFRGFVGTTGFTVRSTSEISEFQIIPPVAVIAEKTTQSFRVTAILTDESVIDLTTTSTWESADDSVAIPGNAPGGKGVFTGISAGDTVVQAFFSDREASAALKVTSAVLVEIQVTPIAPLMAPRSNLQFTALGIFSDGTTQNITTGATWHSSDESKLDVSNAAGFKGFGVAVAPGSVFARASLLGVTGETSVTVTGSELVSITVTPVTPKIALGTKQQFNATGIFQDGTNVDLTNSATWYSSEESVAFVSNSRGRKGLAKGLSAGSSVIRAVFSGVSGTTNLEVTPATLVKIEVTPVQPVLVKGVPTQFTAIGIFSDTSIQNLTNDVTWRSSDSGAVVVSNVAGSKGQGFALKQAGAEVSALFKEYPDDMI